MAKKKKVSRKANPAKQAAKAKKKKNNPPTFAEETHAIDDQAGPMGIRLLSLREDETLALRASKKAAALVIPVHAGRAELDIASTDQTIPLDASTWLLLPREASATLRAKSPVTSTLVLSVSNQLREEVTELYKGEVQPKDFERVLAEVQVLPRTNWVNEICHRYLFERAVCKKKDNNATRFLEAEIVKELYFVAIEKLRSGDERRSVILQRSTVVERALAAIEEDLFGADLATLLAKRSGASASTLLRTFKREMGMAPLDFIRRRRLDESMLLLKAKRYSVGEVAMMVGYKSFGAFSQAFRTRFGMRPSEVTD